MTYYKFRDMNTRKKRKRYSIDGRYNKQIERAQRRQKTGTIIFLVVIGLAALIAAVKFFSYLMQITPITP